MAHVNTKPKRSKDPFPRAIYGKAAMIERQRLRAAGLLNKKTRILGGANFVKHVNQWFAKHPEKRTHESVKPRPLS